MENKPILGFCLLQKSEEKKQSFLLIIAIFFNFLAHYGDMSKNHYTSEYGLNFRREREQKEESDVVSFKKMQINPLMDRNCFFFLCHQIKLCVTSWK